MNENTLTKRCPRCGITKDTIEYYTRKRDGLPGPYCKPCTNEQTLERQKGMKTKCVEYKGGCCQKCGYDKYIGALEFHHLDPSQKDFDISKARSYSFDKAKEELDKCILVCANCHREIHGEKFKDLPVTNSISREEYINNYKRDREAKAAEKVKAAEIRKEIADSYIPYSDNKKTKINWPKVEEMSKLIWEMSTSKLARKLGVSDNAVGKFCDKHGIDKPGRGYWRKVETGNL